MYTEKYTLTIIIIIGKAEIKFNFKKANSMLIYIILVLFTS